MNKAKALLLNKPDLSNYADFLEYGVKVSFFHLMSP